MATIPPESAHSFDVPGIYRIVVEGFLVDEWSDRMGGMTIKREMDQNGMVNTLLVGELADQAALAGVLRSLYNLHMPLIVVEHLPSPEPPHSDPIG